MTRFPRPDARQFSPRVITTFARVCASRSFTSRAAGSRTPAEILLYDEIGAGGITSQDFQAALRDAGNGDLLIRINSPGGDVFDGLAIYNAIQAHPGAVVCQVDGLAASAAAVIAMAGASLRMAESSMLLVERARALVIGNRHDLAEGAAMLDKLDGAVADIFAQATGRPADVMLRTMDAETWFSADEAQAAGFADDVGTFPTGDGGPKARVASRPAARSLAVYSIETRRQQMAALLGKRESLPPSRAAVELARRRLRLADAASVRVQAPTPTEIAAARARVRRAEADGLRPAPARPAAAPTAIAAARHRLAAADRAGVDPVALRVEAAAARRRMVEAARARAAAAR